MAKTLAEKMYIKSGYTVVVVNAPESYLTEALSDLPERVTIIEAFEGTGEIVQVFVTQSDEVAGLVTQAKAAVKDDGAIWLCYPKGGNKATIETDMNRDSLAEIAMAHSLKPNRQVSIDNTWSALRFGVLDS